MILLKSFLMLFIGLVEAGVTQVLNGDIGSCYVCRRSREDFHFDDFMSLIWLS